MHEDYVPTPRAYGSPSRYMRIGPRRWMVVGNGSDDDGEAGLPYVDGPRGLPSWHGSESPPSTPSMIYRLGLRRPSWHGSLEEGGDMDLPRRVRPLWHESSSDEEGGGHMRMTQIQARVAQVRARTLVIPRSYDGPVWPESPVSSPDRVYGNTWESDFSQDSPERVESPILGENLSVPCIEDPQMACFGPPMCSFVGGRLWPGRLDDGVVTVGTPRRADFSHIPSDTQGENARCPGEGDEPPFMDTYGTATLGLGTIQTSNTHGNPVSHPLAGEGGSYPTYPGIGPFGGRLP